MSDAAPPSPFVPRPIQDVARDLGLRADHVEPYGRGKAKIDLAALSTELVHSTRAVAPGSPITSPITPPKGRLILVSAINPTAAGEGKTTTSIALAMGLRRLGQRPVLALREPSLGPVFGVKGGGTGGGKASLVPADEINLHFTGDIHAITSTHNLLAALTDNATYFRERFGENGAAGELDPRQVTWSRAMDMNDRFLRTCLVGLGGKAHGMPRETRFDITAASEVMAILALATDLSDLEARLSRIVVGGTFDGHAVTARDLQASGALLAVLRDALKPNLVQTAEGGPAFVHCGPFANIAHGCNSILATKLAMHTGDYAITEAGFGFDLGGEKFLDIKCRVAGIWPRAVVLVATLRALKLHGGVPAKHVAEPNAEALRRGLSHLEKHLESVAAFGLPAVVALNVFPGDTEDELAMVTELAARFGAVVARSWGFARGGEGALELAEIVKRVVDGSDAAPPQPKFLYDLHETVEAKIGKIVKTVYGARDVAFTPAAQKELARLRGLPLGSSFSIDRLPVCMAKTQLSLSDDATKSGRPRDFTVTVREIRLSAGAGFVMALTGDMMTMPGLPKVPAARGVHVRSDGTVAGLMQND